MSNIISNNEDFLQFLGDKLDEIIHETCNIFEGYSEEEEEEEGKEEEEEEEEEEEGKSDFLYDSYDIAQNQEDDEGIWMIVNEKKENIIDIVRQWIQSQNKEVYELVDYNKKLLDHIDKLKQNRDKKKRIPYENQIVGNSQLSFIAYSNCKKCRGSICGRCVKHGG